LLLFPTTLSVFNLVKTELACVVPEIVHTYLMDSHWKFQGGCLKGHEAKLEFSEGWEIQSKKPSVGEVWISSGTKQFDAKIFNP